VAGVVANVAINVDASKATEQLRQFQRQTQTAARAVENIKVDALNQALNTLPGGLGVAVNGINGFVRKINEAGAASKAATAEIVALQTALASKKLQLAGRGGIGGEAIKAEIKQIESSLASLQGAAKGVSPALLVAGGGVIALTAGLVAMAGASLKFSNEIDRNRQQLTLFTKNVEATNAIIADLKTTADATSLGLPGLLEATKTLAAYGVSAKNAGTATKLLGDLALGDNEKLQRFAVNLGQISSIGRAYTVDLKQFAMAGIPIFEALAKVMGTSTGEVLRLAEQGKVTYPIVIKAINELTKEGASFFNGAERGGTNLDRSLAQLQGSFESLQVVIGNAVGPTAVSGVKILKDALDGVLLIVKNLSNEFEYFSGLIGKTDFGHAIVNELKFAAKYLEQNPDLMMALNPGTKVLGPVGDLLGPLAKLAQNKKKEDTKTNNKTDPTQLLNEANAIARKNAETELANLRIENDKKIAKLNKNTELQLKDNRFQYEQQIADFRESTIRRIADMERTLQDQRTKANFDLQQSQLKLAGSKQFIGQTQNISQAIVSGKSPADIQSLETARDSAKTLNDAAVTRRQIEFDSTMKKIQLERTLTDFKKGIEREIGEMQKSYARQVDGILRTAGRSLGELMVEGAKKAKEIMDGVNPTVGAGETSKRGGMGKVIEYFTGDRKLGAAGGYRADHGGSNYHDHIAYKTAKEAKEAAALLNRSGIKTTELKGVNPVGGHAPRSYHYSGQAFDVPGAQVPVGQEPALSARVRKILQIGTGGAAAKGPAAAALQAPIGSRAMQVDAANSIKPYSPATAKLDQQTKGLIELNNQTAITEKINLQNEYTKSLAESTKTVLEQSTANLNTAIQKNQVDQKTLDLIVSGTNPALAAQFAQNEQLNTQNMLALENQKNKLALSLTEKDLTVEQLSLRINDIALLSQQLGLGNQILENLNQQTIKSKEISDAQAKRIEEGQQLKALYTDIGMSIKSGVVDAIQSAIDGTKSLQEVASNLLKNIASKLLDVAVNMALFGVMSGTGSGGGLLGGFFKPKAAGGPVAGGGNYLVGEKGPELFVPRSSGTIVPADATAAAMARYQRQGGSSDNELDPAAAMARYQRQDGNFVGMGGNRNTTNSANNITNNGYDSNSDTVNNIQTSPSPVLAFSFETTRFLGQDYVSTDQLQAAMKATEKRAVSAGAKAGAAQVSSQMRNSPAYRRQVGLR
jgi:tape measure domain-containing protein